jgi:hypothetical protein
MPAYRQFVISKPIIFTRTHLKNASHPPQADYELP